MPSSSSQSATAARGRRSSARSTRRTVAALLLVLALVVGVAAIVLGSPLMAPGVVVAVLAVAVGARLLIDETAQTRRDWARDRAVQAQQQTRETTVRAREHVAFADHMAETVRAGRQEIERLLAEVLQAQAAYEQAVRRGEALESELAQVRRSLEQSRAELRQAQDALAASQSAELEARTELLAWQQSDETRRYA